MKAKINRLILALATIGLFIQQARGQQDPQYTQYLYNHSIVNPAFIIGEGGRLNAGLLYRAQWVGVEGSPRILNAFGQFRLNDKMQLGLSLVRDDIGSGALLEDNVYADYAYILQLGRESSLSLGLKAGFTFFNSDFEGFGFNDNMIDPAFLEPTSEVFPNIGAGAYYLNKNFYAGISALNLLNARHLDQSDGVINRGREEVHYYLTSGYTFQVLPDIFSMRPSILARGVRGAPMILDLNINLLFYDRFEIGMGYRTSESFLSMFNFRLTPGLRIGYAHDHTVNNLGGFGSSSHEVFLLVNADIFKGNSDPDPAIDETLNY
ncbi:PorP/SprF family type IX secretion system membrane protein [Poritiphilus flavus]|uniref:Type IX secretion system membrane protein PorP/SprF n=1 Tax=Poritiphilus flavus TaxID=2697053 RepID=A0A6L9EEC1_9FLAO|nr:type IX secretion system membrane protein PorP/SprF [Poritiphilus flavus]NAS12888.1 type IX secretion system membrane protein PorP/SprF [Poritiphilus flavus]